ncbi:hypothetical protein K9L97_02560 [Candidatus Woesearchaeota archaeon]|nr:hypothetical protein [Candidatus Woesearchaeota archaeon]
MNATTQKIITQKIKPKKPYKNINLQLAGIDSEFPEGIEKYIIRIEHKGKTIQHKTHFIFSSLIYNNLELNFAVHENLNGKAHNYQTAEEQITELDAIIIGETVLVPKTELSLNTIKDSIKITNLPLIKYLAIEDKIASTALKTLGKRILRKTIEQIAIDEKGIYLALFQNKEEKLIAAYGTSEQMQKTIAQYSLANINIKTLYTNIETEKIERNIDEINKVIKENTLQRSKYLIKTIFKYK